MPEQTMSARDSAPVRTPEEHSGASATAVAHPYLTLIRYWGTSDEEFVRSASTR